MQPVVTTPTASPDQVGDPTVRPLKVIAVVALVATVAWQLYAFALALRYAPTFRQLFEGLGGPLPLLTRWFLVSYPYWLLLPLLFAALALHALRRPRPSVAYLGILVAISFAAALALHAWLQEAVYAPLHAILDKVA